MHENYFIILKTSNFLIIEHNFIFIYKFIIKKNIYNFYIYKINKWNFNLLLITIVKFVSG